MAQAVHESVGASTDDAAAGVGVSTPVAQRWFRHLSVPACGKATTPQRRITVNLAGDLPHPGTLCAQHLGRSAAKTDAAPRVRAQAFPVTASPAPTHDQPPTAAA